MLRPSQVSPRAALRAAAVALGTAALAACASASSTTTSRDPLRDGSAGSQITTRIETPQGAAEMRTVATPVIGLEVSVAAPASRVFGALPEVYEELGLSINMALSDARTVGVRDGRAPRRLAREPLSRYLECGVDATGAAHADTYAVTLTALSRVTVAGDSASVVVTQVLASARPMSTSGNALRCASTGRLEDHIGKAVKLRALR